MAAAEHESLLYLLASFDSVGKKRKGGDGDGDGAGESKRHKAGNLEGGSVAERARLALMRLPTDAARPERSAAAWLHAREAVLSRGMSTESTGRLF